MSIELLETLKNCLASQEAANACGKAASEAIVNAARNTTPLTAGLFTAGALVVGTALIFGCCGSKAKNGSQKSKEERRELPPPSSNTGATAADTAPPLSNSTPPDTSAASTAETATADTGAAAPSDEPRPVSPARRGKSPGRGSRIDS